MLHLQYKIPLLNRYAPLKINNVSPAFLYPPGRGCVVFFFFHPALWPGIHPYGWASTPMGGHFSFIQPSGRASTPMGGHPPPWVGITPLGWKGFGVYSDAEKRSASTQMQKKNRRQLRCRKKVGVYSDAEKQSASTQMQGKGRRLLRCREKIGVYSDAG